MNRDRWFWLALVLAYGSARMFDNPEILSFASGFFAAASLACAHLSWRGQ